MESQSDRIIRMESLYAKRSVVAHLRGCLGNLSKGNFYDARMDLEWAWERMTRTGDYAPNGYFEKKGIDWRKP